MVIVLCLRLLIWFICNCPFVRYARSFSFCFDICRFIRYYESCLTPTVQVCSLCLKIFSSSILWCWLYAYWLCLPPYYFENDGDMPWWWNISYNNTTYFTLPRLPTQQYHLQIEEKMWTLFTLTLLMLQKKLHRGTLLPNIWTVVRQLSHGMLPRFSFLISWTSLASMKRGEYYDVARG